MSGDFSQNRAPVRNPLRWGRPQRFHDTTDWLPPVPPRPQAQIRTATHSPVWLHDLREPRGPGTHSVTVLTAHGVCTSWPPDPCKGDGYCTLGRYTYNCPPYLHPPSCNTLSHERPLLHLPLIASIPLEPFDFLPVAGHRRKVPPSLLSTSRPRTLAVSADPCVSDFPIAKTLPAQLSGANTSPTTLPKRHCRPPWLSDSRIQIAFLDSAAFLNAAILQPPAPRPYSNTPTTVLASVAHNRALPIHSGLVPSGKVNSLSVKVWFCVCRSTPETLLTQPAPIA